MRNCQEIRPLLGGYMDERLDLLAQGKRPEVEAHLRSCPSCSRELDELRWTVQVLGALPVPRTPSDLMGRISARLAQEPLPKAPAKVFWHLPAGWRSFAAGLVVAFLAVGLLRFVLPARPAVRVASLPVISTAAVTLDRNMAVQIGFDVTRNVPGVTFEIDLPAGLRFVNAKGDPLTIRTVRWQGALRTGKTVVPLTLRGVRPGSWVITASVQKGGFKQRTQIVMPVRSGGQARGTGTYL